MCWFSVIPEGFLTTGPTHTFVAAAFRVHACRTLSTVTIFLPTGADPTWKKSQNESIHIEFSVG